MEHSIQHKIEVREHFIFHLARIITTVQCFGPICTCNEIFSLTVETHEIL